MMNYDDAKAYVFKSIRKPVVPKRVLDKIAFEILSDPRIEVTRRLHLAREVYRLGKKPDDV